MQDSKANMDKQLSEAIAEAGILRTQNLELNEELNWAVKEVCALRTQRNSWACHTWMEQCEGLSTVLATNAVVDEKPEHNIIPREGACPLTGDFLPIASPGWG